MADEEFQRLVGGVLAQTAMLNALIATHPEKDALMRAWKFFHERAYAAALGLPGGFLDGFQELSGQLEEQVRQSGGT